MKEKNLQPVTLKFENANGGKHQRTWMRYFAAALCMGVAQGQEQSLLDYWWVYNDEKPVVPDATQVLRVTGEKGEAYEEVYDDADFKAIANKLRAGRLQAMRDEAVELAQKYVADGMSLFAAYEKAWTVVKRRHEGAGKDKVDAAKLEALLKRVSSEGEDQEYTDGELRLVMNALAADDERLDTPEGRLLLEKLAAQLRAMGFTREHLRKGDNGELMSLFVDAMRHGMNSFAAFRDALFKSNSDKIVRHSLFGHLAPWGSGLPGNVRYWQAPSRVTLTVGSGALPLKLKRAHAAVAKPIESPPTVESVKGNCNQETSQSSENKPEETENSFLATAPDESGITSEAAGQPTRSNSTTAEDTWSLVGAEPVMEASSSSSSSGASRTLAFAPRSASAVEDPITTAEYSPDVSVDGAAALYFTSGNRVSSLTKVKRENSSKKRFQVTEYGSYNGSLNWKKFTGENESRSASFWVGDGNVSEPRKGKEQKDTSDNSISNTLIIDLIEMGADDKLYIGGSANYTGTIRVKSGNDKTYLGSYLPQGGAAAAGQAYRLGHSDSVGAWREEPGIHLLIR